MVETLSFEWLKLSKRWMPRIILFLLLGLTVLAFWGYATRNVGRDNLFLPRGWLSALTFSAFFAPFFWPVLGGAWAGNEYSWGTIRAILTRRPQRITHVVAALIVLMVGALVGTVAIVVLGTALSVAVSIATGNPAWVGGLFGGAFAGYVGKGILTAWLVSSFFLLLAYASAVVARSAAVGIAVGIGSTLAEFVLTRIFETMGGVWHTIALHFPIVYTNGVITRVVGPGLIPGTSLATPDPGTPSAGISLAGIAIYAAVLIVAMVLAVRTRDVTA